MCRGAGSYTTRGRGDRRDTVCTTRFAFYHIRNGQNGGLDSALIGMYRENTDTKLGVFQKTKVMVVNYTIELGGYWVAATEAPRPYRGGITSFYCEAEHFTLDALFLHDLNVARL